MVEEIFLGYGPSRVKKKTEWIQMLELNVISWRKRNV